MWESGCIEPHGVGAAAHGGQVLLSETARALVADDLPVGVSLRDLGVHRLKDIDEPLRLYQVVAAGLVGRFPAPRTLPRNRSRRTRLVLVVAVLVIAGVAAAGVLLTTGSASAKQVRLAASSIAVIDPKTGKPVGDVPLGFTPSDVDAGGDKVWVLNRSARTATAIDPLTLKVVQTVGVDGAPDSQYATGGTEWVAFAGRVDEISGSGANKVALWRACATTRPAADGTACFAYVTGDGRTVWRRKAETSPSSTPRAATSSQAAAPHERRGDEQGRQRRRLLQPRGRPGKRRLGNRLSRPRAQLRPGCPLRRSRPRRPEQRRDNRHRLGSTTSRAAPTAQSATASPSVTAASGWHSTPHRCEARCQT